MNRHPGSMLHFTMGTDFQLSSEGTSTARPSHGFRPQGLRLAAAALIRSAAVPPSPLEAKPVPVLPGGIGRVPARSRTSSRIPRVTRGDLAGVQLSGAPAPNAAKLRHSSDTLRQSALQRGQEATRQENQISSIAHFHSPHEWRPRTFPENLTRSFLIASTVFTMISSTGGDLSI